ncbi:hypothetical protein GCM10025789_29840 [Tessaracoccus lubricantis]|uniref:Uncharacterized protein n=1 Tax=Tessaracoccus lubricantis TaxID=545543 RepID=A0ABP9FW67_9ACTN
MEIADARVRASVWRNPHDREGDEQGRKPTTENRHGHDGQKNWRESQNHVHYPHHDGINPATKVAGDESQKDPDDSRCYSCSYGDKNGSSHPV